MKYFTATLFCALSALPLIGQQSTVLFQSDGSSVSAFPCGHGGLGGVATVNSGDGLPAPSIEFFTPELTNVRAAPYVIPGLAEGQVFHGSQDVKFESSKGYISLGTFGMPTDASCPGTAWPGPVPAVGYRIEKKRADWLFVASTGVTINTVAPDGSLDLAIGEWHRAELFMYPQGDGTNHWEFYIDGTLIVSETNYEPIVGPTDAAVLIGFGGQSDQSLVRFDNILVEIIESVSCVGFESPFGGAPVTVRGKNRALPFKAELFNRFGLAMTDNQIATPPVIQVLFESAIGGDAVDVSADALPAGAGTAGNAFVFNDSKWQFNLKTNNYSAPGTYRVSIVTGNAHEYLISDTCKATFVVPE